MSAIVVNIKIDAYFLSSDSAISVDGANLLIINYVQPGNYSPGIKCGGFVIYSS